MMRSMRALLGVCFFVILGLIAVSTFSSSPPSTSTALHSLVTQTHNKLNQLHKFKEELEGDQPIDNSLLTDLGFNENPILFPNHTWFNISPPVIVSAVSWRNTQLVPDLIQVAQTISINSTLIIYSLDVSNYQLKEINNNCNDSCEVLQFDFSHYPSHVKDLELHAFRPIIIQEMLQRSGAVLWLDPCMQLTETALKAKSWLSLWMRKGRVNGGVLTWPLLRPAPHLPTAALTHPDMFASFRTQKNYYDFQKMSASGAILIIHTAMVHHHLMRPWVRCALTTSCLSPVGAQGTGCNYNKKPLFRYSGCHLYDTSAFNVALGLTFGMDNESFLEPQSPFVCLTETTPLDASAQSVEASQSSRLTGVPKRKLVAPKRELVVPKNESVAPIRKLISPKRELVTNSSVLLKRHL